MVVRESKGARCANHRHGQAETRFPAQVDETPNVLGHGLLGGGRHHHHPHLHRNLNPVLNNHPGSVPEGCGVEIVHRTLGRAEVGEPGPEFIRFHGQQAGHRSQANSLGPGRLRRGQGDRVEPIHEHQGHRAFALERRHHGLRQVVGRSEAREEGAKPKVRQGAGPPGFEFRGGQSGRAEPIDRGLPRIGQPGRPRPGRNRRGDLGKRSPGESHQCAPAGSFSSHS